MRRAGEVYVIVKPTGAWLEDSVMFAELVKMGKVTALNPNDVLVVVADSKKVVKNLSSETFLKQEKIVYSVTKCLLLANSSVVYITENTAFPLTSEDYLTKIL